MVGIIVDTVTEVATIPGDQIDESSNNGGGVSQYTVGIARQGGKLVVILDFVRMIEENATDFLTTAVEAEALVEAAIM